MAHPKRSLYIYRVRAECSTLAASRPSGSECGLRCGLGCAAQYLGEEARETEADGWHAGTDYADMTFDYGPERGFEVVPGHIGGVCEVYEGAEANDGDGGDTVGG